MRKKILGIVFAATLLLASALPLVGVGGTAHADKGGSHPCDHQQAKAHPPNGNANSNARANAAGEAAVNCP